MQASQLFIGNLPRDTDNKDVERLLERYGRVGAVKIVTSRHVSFAFATIFCDSETVIKRLNRAMYRGKQIAVSRAKPKNRGASMANTRDSRFGYIKGDTRCSQSSNLK